ncbi:hypothetical protein [Pseudomonas urethralis]|nr:hypothetical protein [Pseudomonas urethralis]
MKDWSALAWIMASTLGALVFEIAVLELGRAYRRLRKRWGQR